MQNTSSYYSSETRTDVSKLFISKVRVSQLIALSIFLVVLLLTPLKRPLELPNPEVPIELFPVAPIPVLKSRLGIAVADTPQTVPVVRAENLNPIPLIQTGTLQPAFTNDEFLAPIISAQTAYLLDVNSMAILYQYQSDMIFSPASTTKLMTALVALELYSLDEVVTVKSGAGLDGASAGLFYSEQLTVESLLAATLIHSANDAAWTLAEHHPEGQIGFVAAMNQKASELGLSKTSFTNPVGFDHPDHKSTARDLAILARAALQHELIAELVATKDMVISDSAGLITHQLATTNELLRSDPTIKGVKTGTTEQAGQVLITLADRSSHPVLLVILGSQDRFRETSDMLSWVYDSYEWVSVDELRAEKIRSTGR